MSQVRLEGSAHPDRDVQFDYLAAGVADHHEAGEPVISVDTKKKELAATTRTTAGNGPRAGSPPTVNVHDFIGEQGRANPYGIYDIGANTGWVSVGTSRDTPAFAVNTIGTWWQRVGRDRYPTATRFMITADGGAPTATGSEPGRPNSPNSRPRPACRSPSVTFPRAPASGTKSSTGCSPISR